MNWKLQDQECAACAGGITHILDVIAAATEQLEGQQIRKTVPANPIPELTM